MQTVNVTDVTLRDGHQCLIATRMRTDDMLPICSVMDEIGFWAMEVWGGATFDACLRFLKEDPWQRLMQLKQALPKTKLSMLLRGQNLLGYRHYADDVVRAFVLQSCRLGIDVFRIFDALNDVRNLAHAVNTVKEGGKHAQGTICYTTSPVHSVKQFVAMGKTLQSMGCDSIAIKDMAGLLTPSATESLVKGLLDAVDIDVHLHSHATSGLASICHYKAIESGCRYIDTAISAFAEGASHPCTESMVAGLKDTEYDTGLDLKALQQVGDYFRKVRKKYHQFESEATGIDPRVQIFQVPGGMISNLYSQLSAQNALDKLDEVHQEIPKVRKDLGYPPLVTPSSQVVGTQAVLNVMTGERYKTITNEVKLYCQGKYGKAPAMINSELQKKAIGGTEPIECRPADLISDEMVKLKESTKSFIMEETDLLSYALFPDVAKQFFDERSSGEFHPEPLLPIGDRNVTSSLSKTFDVSIHGECYHVEVKGRGHDPQKGETIFLTLDGSPQEVLVNAQASESQEEVTKQGRPIAKGEGDITVSMPSTVIEIKGAEGDKVKKDQVLLVTEAMKMETEINTPISGRIKKIYCQKGDLVNPKECLIIVEP